MKPRIAAVIAAIVVVFVAMGVLRAGRKPANAPAANAPAAHAPKAAITIPVEVTVARPGEMLRALEVTGSLRTDDNVVITSRIAGKVARLAAKEGDRVAAGQVLLELDDTELRAQIDQARAVLHSAEERLAQAKAGESMRYAQTDAQIEQAQANLNAAIVRIKQLQSQARVTDAGQKAAVARAESNLTSAKDRLRMVKEGARTQERRVVENAVLQAKANLDTARARATRRRELFAQGAISQEDLDENEKALKLAEAQYNSTVEQRDLMHEGARGEEVRIAEEQVRQAEEGVREAKANLEKTKISNDDIEAALAQKAQITSALKVAQANKSQYQIVPREIAGAQAFVAEQRAKLDYAQQQMSYTKITSPVSGVVASSAVNTGTSITTMDKLMNVVALNSVYFEAQVPELRMSEVRTGLPVKVAVDSLAGKMLRGTVRETIPVASTDGKSFRVRIAVVDAGPLPVGAFARGVIETGKDAKAILIPKDCLLSLAGENYVFRVTDGTVERVGVQVGDTDAANAQILAGLKEGDRVVSSGAATLNDGAKVRIVSSGATSAR